MDKVTKKVLKDANLNFEMADKNVDKELKDLIIRLNTNIALLDGNEYYKLRAKDVYGAETQYQLKLLNNSGTGTGQFGHLSTWLSYKEIKWYMQGICDALEWNIN